MELTSIPTFDDDGLVQTIIETPKGTPNKMKWDPGLGTFLLSKVLPAGMVFPFDFGFVPGTIAADGDPEDVLVLLDAPVHPGTVVPSRLIGVIEAEQKDDGWERNDRLIAVPACSVTQTTVHHIDDLDSTLLDQVEAFFADYNRVQGRGFRVLRRRGPKAALDLVDASRKAARKASKPA